MTFALALLMLALIFVGESTDKLWVVVVMPEGEFVKCVFQKSRFSAMVSHG